MIEANAQTAESDPLYCLVFDPQRKDSPESANIVEDSEQNFLFHASIAPVNSSGAIFSYCRPYFSPPSQMRSKFHPPVLAVVA